MTLRERAYSAVLEERDALRAELAAARQEAERLQAEVATWRGRATGLRDAIEETQAESRARLDRAEALLREA
jgi:predicted  nucleic acid-binding Zn-ribbon protein